MASLTRRLALRGGLAGFAGLAVLSGSALAGSGAKVGLIDLALNPQALNMPGVTIRHMSFWATGYVRAVKQGKGYRRDHGEVMARALIEAYRAAASGQPLELYVASPFVETPEGAKLLDLEQLPFAFEWFAASGVKIVAMTFVGRASPALAAALGRARELGLVVLSSAGNGPDQNPVPAYPAAYGDVIAVGTTALDAAREAEDRLLHQVAAGDAPRTRGSYVDYAVTAPALNALKLRQDPEAAALMGSSRATVVAAGLLAALAGASPPRSADEALAFLDGVAMPCAPDVARRGVIDPQKLNSGVGLRGAFKPDPRRREAA